MRNHSRPLAVGLAIAATIAVLSGCTAPEPPKPTHTATAGPVSLDYTMPDVFTKTIDAVTAQVNGSGDITLEPEVIGNTYNDLTQRLVADVAAGTQSDLALVPLNRIPNFIAQGIVQPIGDILEEQGVAIDDLDPAAVKLAEVDGKLYGVPFALSAPMLYYNADLFKAAGLDPDDPPTTWADVRADAKALVAAGGGGVVYQWDQDQWVFQSQVRSAGGEMLSKDGKKIAFDSTAGIKALTNWTGLVSDGLFPVLTSTPTPDDRSAFTGGQIGMWVGSSAFAASVKSQVNFDVRTTQFPSEDGSATPLAAGGSAIVLLSTDPDIQARAASVLAEFASPETSTALVQNTGYLPINATARDSAKYLKGFLADQPLRQPAIKEIDRLEPWTSYAGNRSVEISALITKDLEAALKGAKSPKDALTDAADQADKLIGVE